MANAGNQIDLKVDVTNLYREENITDLKVASIRRLTPVDADGNPDESRAPVFMGSTHVMTPEGPLPIQATLQANNLKEAIEAFPKDMEVALNQMIEQLQRMQQAQKGKDDSRIIVPGR